MRSTCAVTPPATGTADYCLTGIRDDVLGLLDVWDLPPRRAALLSGVGPVQLLAATATVVTTRREYELRAMRSIFRQLSRPDLTWWQRLGDARQPTLVLSGGPSSLIPLRRLAEVAAAIPGARLTTIPVGHRVHSLAPGRFTAEVVAFLVEEAAGPARLGQGG